MRQYYLALLMRPEYSMKYPMGYIFPRAYPHRQFDTIDAAREARNQIHTTLSQSYTWEIIDIWATLKSPTLVIIE